MKLSINNINNLRGCIHNLHQLDAQHIHNFGEPKTRTGKKTDEINANRETMSLTGSHSIIYSSRQSNGDV